MGKEKINWLTIAEWMHARMNEWMNWCIFTLQIIYEISQYERVNALTTKPHGFRSVSGTPASLFFNKQESNPLKKDSEVDRYRPVHL